MNSEQLNEKFEQLAVSESWSEDEDSPTYIPNVEEKDVVRGPLINKSKSEKRKHKLCERARHANIDRGKS